MPVPVESPSSTSVTDEVVTIARVVLPAEFPAGGTEVRDEVVTATEAATDLQRRLRRRCGFAVALCD
jgi:hypothetical protein